VAFCSQTAFIEAFHFGVCGCLHIGVGTVFTLPDPTPVKLAIQKLKQLIHKEYPIRAEEQKWRDWVDSRLVHVITPNIYRTVGESIQAFDYMTTKGNFTIVERCTLSLYFALCTMK
jgi:hypothetical protein